MKVYLCGSFKFFDDMHKVNTNLRSQGIQSLMSEPEKSVGICGCLKNIEKSDILYVINPDGYIGKSVSIDIGYALGLGKKIYSLQPISDPPISDLIDGVKSTFELMHMIKRA